MVGTRFESGRPPTEQQIANAFRELSVLHMRIGVALSLGSMRRDVNANRGLPTRRGEEIDNRDRCGVSRQTAG